MSPKDKSFRRKVLRQVTTADEIKVTLSVIFMMGNELYREYELECTLVPKRSMSEPSYRSLMLLSFHNDFFMGKPLNLNVDWQPHHKHKLLFTGRFINFIVLPHMVSYIDIDQFESVVDVLKGDYYLNVNEMLNGVPVFKDRSIYPEIICAAVKVGDVVLSSVRHFDKPLNTMLRHCTELREYNTKMRHEAENNPQLHEQGFQDIHGRFLNRRDAMTLVKLRGTPLSPSKTSDFDILYSEDVWWI